MLVSDAYARIDFARHYGGSYDQQTVLNQAGAHFYACRPWRFARRMTGRANLAANSQHIVLPLGCSRVLSIEPDGDILDGAQILIVDATTFNQQRTAIDVDSINFYATEDWYQSPDGSLVRRLALHRAPGNTVSAAFRLAFEAEWMNIPTTTLGESVLPIPAFAEPAFGLMLDAFAIGLEEDRLDELVARVQMGPVYAAAVSADERAIPALQPWVGGWTSEMSLTREPDPTITLEAP